MKKRPYLKLWKSDFRDGSRMLSRPAKLLYFELIMLLDDCGGLIPDDLKWITRHIGAHDSRVVRKPLEELIEAGKIQRSAKGLTNKRIARELGDDDEGDEGGQDDDAVEEKPTAAPPASSTQTVEKPVCDVGEKAPLRADCASTAPPLSVHYPQSNSQAIENTRDFRGSIHSHSHIPIHEVVVVGTEAPRARASPDAQARASPELALA